jgi:hypothetical protein
MTGLAHRASTRCADSLQRKTLVLRALLAGILAASTLTESAPSLGKTNPAPAAPASAASQPAVAPRPLNTVNSGREALMLRRLWGIDDIHIRSTASGNMLRFSYRVVDADKAKILNDKRAEPYLVVLKTGTRLTVPETEKVGKLRQTATPEYGREYWMVFTNLGRAVEPGDHVDVVIGAFRGKELVVESGEPPARVHKP